MSINRGDRLDVRTAFDDWVPRVALSGPELGATFEVVWVCTVAEWDRAEREHEEPDGTPWPISDVVPATSLAVPRAG